MIVEETFIKGLLVLKPLLHEDNRGWFMETYTGKELAKHGIPDIFVQDNQSYNKYKGTLRGLHFQRNPMAQSKLVRCIRGALMDVAVDLRRSSETYKKWFALELNAVNKTQLYIPKGFAHGYITLTDDTELFYKVDAFYSKECDGGIAYNDPGIGVDWKDNNPILSEKDLKLPRLKDADIDF
jgi:dTDP-4-dehydrorhamnose 3,5-epimerase